MKKDDLLLRKSIHCHDAVIDETMDAIGFGRFQVILLLICGLSFISDAMEVVLITFVIKPLRTAFQCSDTEVSFLASAIFLGMLCGSVFMGPLSDAIGRKKSFLICMGLVNVGGFGSISSTSPWIFLAYRFIVGIGVGGLHISVVILTEFVPMKHRALLITVLQGFWSLGVLFEVSLAWLLEDYSWKALVFFSALPAFLAAITVLYIPESPLYLISKKKFHIAKNVFAQMAQTNGKQIDLHAIAPRELSISSHSRSSFERLKSLFSIGVYRKTLFYLTYLWFVGSFNYCGSLFLAADLNFSGTNSYGTVFLISCGELVSKAVSFALLSGWSRRRNISVCLWICLGSCMVTMLKDRSPAWITVASMLVFRIAISMFLTTLSLYTPECFPTEMRSTGFGIATSGSRVGGMITPFIAIMVKSLSFFACMVVFIVTLVCAELSVRLLPLETKHMSLNRRSGEEILGT